MLPTNSPYQAYLLNCQSGPLVLFKEVAHGGLFTEAPENTSPENYTSSSLCAYARIDKVTGRLLIHFIKKSSKRAYKFLQFFTNELIIREACVLETTVFETGVLERSKYVLSPGTYPLMDDVHLLTASVRLTPQVKTRASALKMRPITSS